MTNYCKNCNNRTARCHCDCELYAEYLKQLNAVKQTIEKNKNDDRRLREYEYRRIHKLRKYVNKEK